LAHGIAVEVGAVEQGGCGEIGHEGSDATQMSFPRARETIATDVSILGENSRKVILQHGNLWRSSRPTRESTGPER
jgi:hypothetical protein